MADKKALIVLACNATIAAEGDFLTKLLKKAALFTDYTCGTVTDGFVEADLVTKAQPADLAGLIENGEALTVIDLGDADTTALNQAFETIFDAVDRKTIIAVAGKGSLALYGNSVDGKAGNIARKANATDIVPTLAYVADFPITKDCIGGILYQGLKSPNLKLDETTKLKEALIRMESVIARDNREPWDKHDCA